MRVPLLSPTLEHRNNKCQFHCYLQNLSMGTTDACSIAISNTRAWEQQMPVPLLSPTLEHENNRCQLHCYLQHSSMRTTDASSIVICNTRAWEQQMPVPLLSATLEHENNRCQFHCYKMSVPLTLEIGNNNNGTRARNRRSYRFLRENIRKEVKPSRKKVTP